MKAKGPILTGYCTVAAMAELHEGHSQAFIFHWSRSTVLDLETHCNLWFCENAVVDAESAVTARLCGKVGTAARRPPREWVLFED